MNHLYNDRALCLVASGDLRPAANENCWAAQEEMEASLTKALQKQGWPVKRAHAYDPVKKHGFIDSQKMGMDVFRNIHPDVPLIIAESVWQYSHHVRSEEHTSELQSLMRISYAVFGLKKKNTNTHK